MNIYKFLFQLIKTNHHVQIYYLKIQTDKVWLKQMGFPPYP